MKVLDNTGTTFQRKKLSDMTTDDIFFGFDDATPCVRVMSVPGLSGGDGAIMRLSDHAVDFVASGDEFKLVVPPAGLVL